jgi:hypothetical protein
VIGKDHKTVIHSLSHCLREQEPTRTRLAHGYLLPAMSLVKTLHTATGNALRRVIVTIYLVFPVEVSLHTMALIILLSPFALPVLPPTFPLGLLLPFILFYFHFVLFCSVSRHTAPGQLCSLCPSSYIWHYACISPFFCLLLPTILQCLSIPTFSHDDRQDIALHFS